MVAAAGALVAAAGAAALGGSSHTGGARAARSAARYFLHHYEQPDGRVVRWDQGGDTVSEGQGYAMLVAAAIGDRRRFAAAWSWSRTHLLQPDGLLAWHYAHGQVVGHQPSADADLDVAWALTVGARRFADPAYRRAAQSMADAILTHEVQQVAGRPVLLAGPWAAGRDPVIDPSYLAPSDLEALATLGPHRSTWRALSTSSTDLLRQLLRGRHLPPEWAQVSTTGAVAATGPPSNPGGRPTYGFGAVRVPVRLAAACNAEDVSLAGSLWPVLARQLARHRPLVGLRLRGTPRRSASPAPVGLVGAAGAAAAAGHQHRAGALLAEAARRNLAAPTYYGSAWVALGRILLQTSDLGSCPP